MCLSVRVILLRGGMHGIEAFGVTIPDQMRLTMTHMTRYDPYDSSKNTTPAGHLENFPLVSLPPLPGGDHA